MREVISQDYFGFGDNIYKRPFIKALAQAYDKVYVYTAFPELFSDIPNVVFCKPYTQLKTQSVWIDYHSKIGTYSPKPFHCTNRIKLNYGRNFKRNMSIANSFEEVIPVKSLDMTLPDIERGKEGALQVFNSIPKNKKLCIVRLPSIRREWACETRNPKMEYFNLLMQAYKREYYFLSIGDIDDNERFSEQPNLSLIDYKYHSKELNLWETVNLIKLADMMISMPCFTLPLAISLNTPAFFIYGGYVKHDLLVDSRMKLDKIEYVEPIPFCNCVVNSHNCNKIINETELINKFDAFVRRSNIL